MKKKYGCSTKNKVQSRAFCQNLRKKKLKVIASYTTLSTKKNTR